MPFGINPCEGCYQFPCRCAEAEAEQERAPASRSVFLSSCCLSSEMTTRGGDDEFGDHSWIECQKCGEPCEPIQYEPWSD